VKVDASLQEKLQEKERLDNYVKQLREERKKREELEKRSLDLKLPNISSPSNLVKPRTSVSTNSTTLPAIHSYGTEIGKGVPNSDPIPIKQPQKPSNSATGLLRPMSQDASPITFQKLKEEPSESPRSGLLKRSHSHPNIAQVIYNEIYSRKLTVYQHFSDDVSPCIVIDRRGYIVILWLSSESNS
jgi:hypothetical protein